MALPAGTARVGDILGNQGLIDRILPSGSDITTVGRHGIDYHELQTPFVHQGGGVLGNPPQGARHSQGVTVIIAGASPVGRNGGNPVFHAQLVMQDQNNNVIWRGEAWSEHLVQSPGEFSILYTGGPPSGMTPTGGNP